MFISYFKTMKVTLAFSSFDRVYETDAKTYYELKSIYTALPIELKMALQMLFLSPEFRSKYDHILDGDRVFPRAFFGGWLSSRKKIKKLKAHLTLLFRIVFHIYIRGELPSDCKSIVSEQEMAVCEADDLSPTLDRLACSQVATLRAKHAY